MTLLVTHLVAIAAGVLIGGAAARYGICQRKTKADELRFLLSPVVPHSVEDAARRAGA